MIVVVTGTHVPFRRLIDLMAEWARRNEGEVVWLQHGPAAIAPPLVGEPLVHREKLLSLLVQADAVVTHGGSGAISDAIECGHVPVVMPRRHRFGEHINDHQVDICSALHADGRAFMAETAEEMEQAIAASKARKGTGRVDAAGRARFLAAIEKDLRELTAQSRPRWGLATILRSITPSLGRRRDRPHEG